MGVFGVNQQQPIIVRQGDQGGGTLNFIRSVLESGEMQRAVNRATEEFFPIRQAFMQLVEGGNTAGAAKLIARQRHEIAAKYGDSVAEQVTGPAFRHLFDAGNAGAMGNADPQGRAVDLAGAAAFAPGAKPGQAGVQLSQVLRNSAAGRSSDARAGLAQAQTESERAMLPLQQQSEGALAAQRGAGAYANAERGNLSAAQRTQLLPEQVGATRALAEQRRWSNVEGDSSSSAGGGKGGGIGKLTMGHYNAAYNDLEQSLQSGALAGPGAVEGRVAALNDMARRLNQEGQHQLPQMELAPVQRKNSAGEMVETRGLRPMAGSTADPAQRQQLWAAEDQAAGQPPARPQAPAMSLRSPGPTPIQAPPEMPLQQQAPTPAPTQQQAPPPGDVGDMTALMGSLAQEAQRRAVTRSEVRQILAQLGIQPGSPEEQAIWQHLTGGGAGAVR